MLRRTLSSPTSPGGHPPCLLSRGREGEERRPRKNPRSQKETALTKKEGESHHQKPKKNELNKTKQRKTNLHRKRREVAGGNIEEKDLMT